MPSAQELTLNIPADSCGASSFSGDFVFGDFGDFGGDFGEDLGASGAWG